MELRQLQCFALVATYENMTLAAKELHIAQPAVSQSIARLEEEIGVVLFDRIGKKIKLNRQGLHLLNAIPNLLGPFEIIKTELKQIELNPVQVIKILVLSSSVHIPEILKRFVDKNPNTNFIISQREFGFDYDVCISSVASDEKVDDGQVLLEEEIQVVIPMNNLLARKKEITMGDLLAEDYITLSEKSVFSRIMKYYFNQSNIQLKGNFEAESPSMVRGLIEAGLGISFYPTISWGPLSMKYVIARRMSDFDCGRKIILKTHKTKEKNQSLEDFSLHIIDYFQKLAQDYQCRRTNIE